jgi:hypothetical protein
MVARRANNLFTMKFTHLKAYIIPDELLLPIARKFGYVDGEDRTPQQAIQDFYNHRNNEERNRILAGISEFFGGAGQEQIDTAMATIDESTETSTIIVAQD